jgi:hypothetical protein
MPITGLVLGYIAVAALITCGIVWLVRKTPAQQTTRVLVLILLVGALARLSQIGASTVLEDDYYRYLWDGAVVAIGQSPFAYAPIELLDAPIVDPVLSALATAGQDVLYRINYPEYRTIYPPALQAVFAASHWVAPFSLDGRRVVLFAFELGTVGVIYALLMHLGRSPLWLALYWWHPIVIKEIANSAHMEPVLMLPVMVALYAVVTQRVLLCSAALAIGAGVKLWPAVLALAMLRARWIQPQMLIFAAGLMGALLAVQAWPIVAAGLDDSSGFVAFGKHWRASSAVILVAQSVAGLMPDAVSANAFAPRLILGAALFAVLLIIWSRPARSPTQTMRQMVVIAAAIYLLSPSTTPWYFLWIAPFLCLFPVRGLLLAGALLPVHYVYFHLLVIDRIDLYRTYFVWMIWVPVWSLLAWEAWRAIRSKSFGEKVIA